MTGPKIILRQVDPTMVDDGTGPKLARLAMAYKLFGLYVIEGDPEKKADILKSATIGWIEGMRNEALGFHRHRPLGTKGPRIDDSGALACMRLISKETGETRGETLAKAAIKCGVSNLSDSQSEIAAIKRLASRWRQDRRSK